MEIVIIIYKKETQKLELVIQVKVLSHIIITNRCLHQRSFISVFFTELLQIHRNM